MKWSEMSARERDALVAEKVMGLEHREWKPYCAPEGWYPVGAPNCFDDRPERIAAGYKQDLPGYSWDIAAAWEVHERAKSWLFSKRQMYLEALTDTLRERHPVDGGVVAWPDLLLFLVPEAICIAALRACGVRVET